MEPATFAVGSNNPLQIRLPLVVCARHICPKQAHFHCPLILFSFSFPSPKSFPIYGKYRHNAPKSATSENATPHIAKACDLVCKRNLRGRLLWCFIVGRIKYAIAQLPRIDSWSTFVFWNLVSSEFLLWRLNFSLSFPFTGKRGHNRPKEAM